MNGRPRCAAIYRLVDVAIFAGKPQLAGRPCEQGVRVSGRVVCERHKVPFVLVPAVVVVANGAIAVDADYQAVPSALDALYVAVGSQDRVVGERPRAR